MVITRFAPSPTGYLHIGNARTAIFSYLYARANGGKLLLRIEDTDKARSTQFAIDVILRGMDWLGLDYDGDAVYQSANIESHKQVAQQLLATGKAYKCYSTSEELATLREAAQAEGKVFTYPNIWRDKPQPEGDLPYSIRLKTPLEGSITIADQVQGNVTVQCSEIDDFVLMRSDGTPTYMLAVVVDDHNMGITNIVRGNDHMTNSFKQHLIYEAMGWSVPQMAHLPLIHGEDGAKMSKRHGALGVHDYEADGYLPEALFNYLLRMGWSHGDDEIISKKQAIEWFSLDNVGKSPARFDKNKLDDLNKHYIKQADNFRLAGLISSDANDAMIALAKTRSGNLLELADNVKMLAEPPKGAALCDKERAIIADIKSLLADVDWNAEDINNTIKQYIKDENYKFPQVAMPLRVALTGEGKGANVGDIMTAIGKKETLERLG